MKRFLYGMLAVILSPAIMFCVLFLYLWVFIFGGKENKYED
jgi:hypothetical protein